MQPTNLVIFMADEHNPKMLGCAGHPLVKTPNLDTLAAKGTRFVSAYTNSPICVPARASFATGRYVHEIGYWDNAIAYDGRVPGWGHRLQQQGYSFTSVGKLHYRFEQDPTGIDEQIIPMHIANGTGDLLGLLRPDVPVRHKSRKYAEQVGPGETEYIHYDREISHHASQWLQSKAQQSIEKPWVLFVSFIAPHFPLIVPEEYYSLYPIDQIPDPKPADLKLQDQHPWWKAFFRSFIFDQCFEDDQHRKTAIASYLGLCTFTDENIGRVLQTIKQTGLEQNTRIAYISDHGDNMGARRLWGKGTMYQESAGIPMILSGPDIPTNKIVTTPVSLIDFYPTILECVGIPLNSQDLEHPGQSLLAIAQSDNDLDRLVLSEYHSAASISGVYMLRKGKYKYIHYTYYEPELYDLESDPEELNNLAPDNNYAEVLLEFNALLKEILGPENIDQQAKHDQAALLEKHGGRDKVLERGGLHGTPVPT